ncbi:uncharacterized protein LOC128387217 [Panonychus citri]|uniref:uncharacterized protein LOC128387217 n=1 Tax=Panonychus citri TaxID=50023 RepID=UPI0023073F3B|nr:uncharacterized protein LOC128387217 [Panonychus citri]
MSYTIIIVITFTLVNCCLHLVSSESLNEPNGWINSNPTTTDQQSSKLFFLKYLIPNGKSINNKNLAENQGWLLNDYFNQPMMMYGKRESGGGGGSRLADDLPPPPPGFVGSRGRRAGELIGSDIDIRSTLINRMAKSMGISPLLLIDRLRQNESKKKDLLPYKDAFMGSRG